MKEYILNNFKVSNLLLADLFKWGEKECFFFIDATINNNILTIDLGELGCEDIIIDSQGSIRYGFLKLNYAKMLQEWVKDIPQVSVNNTQIRVKNEYLQDIRLNSQEIELELY